MGNFLPKDHIHHHLESSGGIGQSEEHNHWFEEPFGGKECRLPFIALFDADVVVSPSYVKLGKEGAASKAVDGLGYKRGYVAVLLGPSVDRAIVLDRAEFPVLFFDEEEICGVGAP